MENGNGIEKAVERASHFTSLELARSFAARSVKPSMVFDDPEGGYLVTTLADGERLIRSGVEPL